MNSVWLDLRGFVFQFRFVGLFVGALIYVCLIIVLVVGGCSLEEEVDFFVEILDFFLRRAWIYRLGTGSFRCREGDLTLGFEQRRKKR